MFLYILNDNEKFAFLNLCSRVAKASKCSTKIQRSAIEKLAYECDINYIVFNDLENGVEDLELYFKKSSLAKRKAVLFEIICFALSDSLLEATEQKIIYDFAEKINMTAYYSTAKEVAKKYISKKNSLEKYFDL